MTAAPSIQRARALAAADALPPTFPIATFVAANPLRGVEHLSFEHAAAHAAATSGAESFLSEAEYRRLHAAGSAFFSVDVSSAHLRTQGLRFVNRVND